MKITKEFLKQVIKEELKQVSEVQESQKISVEVKVLMDIYKKLTGIIRELQTYDIQNMDTQARTELHKQSLQKSGMVRQVANEIQSLYDKVLEPSGVVGTGSSLIPKTVHHAGGEHAGKYSGKD